MLMSDALRAEFAAERDQIAPGQMAMPSPAAEILPNEAPPRSDGSYSQILKSSSIVGGAQVATLLLGMARIKGVALLIGPAGIGEVSLLVSATQLLANVS